jgi:hypothetical protein
MDVKHCTHCRKPIGRPVHPNTARPFCNSTCYGLWQRGKSFAQQDKPARQKLGCKVQQCDAPHFGRGYCRKHYLSEHYAPKPQQTARADWKEERACVHCGNKFWPPLKQSRYCSIKCSAAARKKPFILKKGYRKLLIPSHPRADAKGYVFEHIVVVEAVLGRSLKVGEEVHHKDRNRANNAPSNLVVCASHAEHMKLHARPCHAIE